MQYLPKKCCEVIEKAVNEKEQKPVTELSRKKFKLAYEAVKRFYRMAGFWSMRCHWRKNGDSHLPYSYVVYVYFFSYAWLSYYHLYGYGVLDKYETLYSGREAQSFTLSLN